MKLSRRTFIGTLGLTLSSFLPAVASIHPFSTRSVTGSKNLVIIHLAGGNDGLNTIVPYGSHEYYKLRPTLAIKPNSVLPLNNMIGLHPSMSALFDIYEQGKLAVVLGVGYPDQSRSHFRSMDIWRTGEPEKISNSSWFERCPGLNQVNIDGDIINSRFSRKLELIAQKIAASDEGSVYYLSLDGFDTHNDQLPKHSHLLQVLSDSLVAFQKDLEEHNTAENVLVLAYSEFGRSIAENDSHGTDHGTAQPCLIMGTSVKGGIYGDYPNLTNLAQGHLKHTIDFRTIYATLLEHWLAADSKAVLGQRLPTIGFV